MRQFFFGLACTCIMLHFSTRGDIKFGAGVASQNVPLCRFVCGSARQPFFFHFSVRRCLFGWLSFVLHITTSSPARLNFLCGGVRCQGVFFLCALLSATMIILSQHCPASCSAEFCVSF